MFIGVDVGGTNTDAVIIHSKSVVCFAKVITSKDVTSGIREVVRLVLEKVPQELKSESVQHISIGTTHFLNAVIQKRGLAKVTVVRLCGKSSTALPPFVDFPNDLKLAIRGEVFLVDGGFYVDGRIATDVNEAQIVEVSEQIHQSRVRNVVVAGIYSQLDPSQEELVAKILRTKIPQVSITLSHKIGHMGLLERENAAILNESLKPLCKKTLFAFKEAIQGLGMHCPIFLTQNDGTLASIEICEAFPVYTFASGPTNSMRGAAFLTGSLDIDGIENAMVVDIGGTTSDIGQLINGFPREASARVKARKIFVQSYFIEEQGNEIVP